MHLGRCLDKLYVLCCNSMLLRPASYDKVATLLCCNRLLGTASAHLTRC